MEEMNQDPCGINRSKRKFEDEILEVREAKHTCLEKSSTPSTSNIQSEGDLKMSNDNIVIHSQGSVIDSNSFSEDADSVMSLSDHYNSRMKQHIMSPYNSSSSSSSSVNWSGSGSCNSFDRSETKTCNECYGYAAVCPSFELDCEFSSSGFETKESEDEEASMEDLFCSNGKGVLSNNYILSSGRWNVNPQATDAEQGTPKLTIDKEFEQYFSSLMLS